MDDLRKRLTLCCGLPLLVLLGGCSGAKPECDTPETRSAVLKVIADDHSNRLGTYAASQPPASQGVPIAPKNLLPNFERSSLATRRRRGSNDCMRRTSSPIAS